jgi:hypothetical protein
MTPSYGLIGLHPSRVTELAGMPLPDWRLAPMGRGWGDSVSQAIDNTLHRMMEASIRRGLYGGLIVLLASVRRMVFRIVNEAMHWLRGRGSGAFISIEAGRSPDAERTVRALARRLKSDLVQRQHRAGMRCGLLATVFEALGRDGRPKFNAHVIVVMPDAHARDRLIESLHGSSVYGGHVDARPVENWNRLTTYLLKEGTSQAWFAARKSFRRIRGSIPLRDLGGDRVVLSRDLRGLLIATGRIQPFQRTYAKRQRSPFPQAVAHRRARSLTAGRRPLEPTPTPIPAVGAHLWGPRRPEAFLRRAELVAEAEGRLVDPGGAVHGDGLSPRQSVRPRRSAAESARRPIVEWLNTHPVSSDPDTCCWCNEPERSGDVLLPFGVEPMGRAWPHGKCGGVGVSTAKPRRRSHWQRCDCAPAEIEAINERLNEIAEAVTLPNLPARREPDLAEKEPLPLIDSAWGFLEGTLRLKADKAYAEINEEE